MKAPVFVIGPPRSGTSLLGQILGLAQDTRYLGETGIFSHIYFASAPWARSFREAAAAGLLTGPASWATGRARHLRDRVRRRDRLEELARNVMRFCRVPDEYDLMPKNPLPDAAGVRLREGDAKRISTWVAAWREALAESPGAFARAVFASALECTGDERVVEKTPAHVWSLPFIKHHINETRVVLIRRRDTRAVLSSYYLLCSRKRSPVIRFAKRYRTMMDRCNEFAALHPEAVKVIYEDLLADPPGESGRLFSELGMRPGPVFTGRLSEIRPTASKYDQLSSREKGWIDTLSATLK
ncbi:sulfotransferase family protein [Kiritimatiella glycovorans]|nr:sulfotransferase [Kiritimatiella glycovorans]